MSIRCIVVNSFFIMLVLKSYVNQLQISAKSFIPGISRDNILKLVLSTKVTITLIMRRCLTDGTFAPLVILRFLKEG